MAISKIILIDTCQEEQLFLRHIWGQPKELLNYKTIAINM